MTRQWRDERLYWWDVWNVRWRWVCEHGYSHHASGSCVGTEKRFWRRRWWSYFPGETAFLLLVETIPFRLARLKSRYFHCAGAKGGVYGRGLRCNCQRCPGSNGGPHSDLRPCRPCRKDPVT